MSGKAITRHMLTCDGCGASIGENGEYANPAESRAAAAERGWIVVPKLRGNGKPVDSPMNANGRVVHGHDVCPTCQPTFQPERIRAGGSTYWQRLQEENRRLREELRRASVPPGR